MTATCGGYSFLGYLAGTYSYTLASLSHMVRPAGPRISSMISPTRSSPSTLVSRRSVESSEPTSDPVDDTCSANSKNSRSTMFDEPVPRLAHSDMRPVGKDLLVPVEIGGRHLLKKKKP